MLERTQSPITERLAKEPSLIIEYVAKEYGVTLQSRRSPAGGNAPYRAWRQVRGSDQLKAFRDLAERTAK